MRNLLGTCTFLLTATVFAQSPASPTLLVAPPVSTNCPVGLAAQHTRDGGMVNVGNSFNSGKAGYNLTLSPQPQAAKRRIANATVTLHGPSGAGLQPAAGKDADDATDATEHITLSPWIGQDHSFHVTIYTGKLTTVRWIELNALTYADGTSWHESPAAACRVTPNNFLLTAGN